MKPRAQDAISSPHNALFRRWLLAREKPDRRSGEILLEGLHLISDWTQRYGRPEALLLSLDHQPGAELQAWLAAHPVALEWMAPALFARLSSLDHFSGPIALVRTGGIGQGRVPQASQGDLVYLDRVQDPGNLGTILRSCAALGVTQVALSPGTVWPWGPKVLRAGMSAHFEVVLFEEFAPAQMLQLQGFQRIVTSGQADPASQPLHALNLRSPVLWCFGNEGSGLSAEILAAAGGQRAYVPHSGRMESLNVASALAICLYEQQRQRLPAG